MTTFALRRPRTPTLLATLTTSMLAIACVETMTPETSDAGEVETRDAGEGESGSDGGPSIPADGGSAEDVDSGPPGVDAGAAPPGRIAAFVATGYVGRSMLSCDDGRSWVADQSDDESVRCFDGVDCDHHAGRTKGIVFTGRHFLASYGWGTPGGVRRSEDGVRWEEVLADTRFGGIAVNPADGRVLAGARRSQITDDDGETWVGPFDTGLGGGFNVRRAGYGGGAFVLVGNNASEIVVSNDGSDGTWGPPRDIPSSCGASIQNQGGIAYGGGTLLILGGDGVACASDDGGQTWEANVVGESVSSHVVWNGSEFVAWAPGIVYRSADGRAWSTTETSPQRVRIGAVAFNPETGTYVAINGGWNQWYDNQVAYRSDDGTTWETLADGAFRGGHPIYGITFGWVEPSEECPEE